MISLLERDLSTLQETSLFWRKEVLALGSTLMQKSEQMCLDAQAPNAVMPFHRHIIKQHPLSPLIYV
jgi:hypothetical protein